MQRRRNVGIALASNSLVYLIGSVAVGIANVILLPLYTRYLSSEQFGVYALIDITVLVLLSIVSLGYNFSYLKWFADVDTDTRPTLLGSAFWSSSLASLLGGIGLVLWLFSAWGQSFFAGYIEPSLAWIALPLVVLGNAQNIFQSDLRAHQQSVGFAASSVVRVLGMMLASVWFVVYQRYGVAGVFYGRLIGDILGTLFLSLFCFKRISFTISWEIVRPMLRFGLPIVYSALVTMLLDASSRYFLNHYSNLQQVGYYAVGVKVSAVIATLLTQPFGTAWGGVMFQIAKRQDAKNIYARIFTYVFAAALAVSIVSIVFAPLLFAMLTSPAYAPAMTIFPILLFVQMLLLLQYPASVGIYIQNDTGKLPWIYISGFIVTVVANYLSTPVYGMVGAALSWLAGWTVIWTLVAIYSQRNYPIQYHFKTLSALVLVFLVTWLFSGKLSTEITLSVISMRFILSSLCLLVIIAITWLDTLRSKNETVLRTTETHINT